MISHDSQIIIVGAGVFGLSTALWLARSGFKDIRVFDRCEVDVNSYDPSKGCDGASADINKIYRASYGSKKHYQALALEAKDMWLEWDEAIKTSKPSDLPPSMTSSDRLVDMCGLLYLGEGKVLHQHYAQSLQTAEKEAPETRKLQFIKNDPKEEQRLADEHGPRWSEKLHIFDEINKGDTHGVLDVGAGITIADKACTYAHFLCERAGVKFILGSGRGAIERLLVAGSGTTKRAIGIQTLDGLSHAADLVIVAAGPWSPTIIPEASQVVQASAGTVMFIDLPPDRPDLHTKFHPNNFPAWSYRRGEGDNYYQGGGFPATDKGRLKFGFLGRKYTNFVQHPTSTDGEIKRVSVPRTRYTADPITSVPLYGLDLMKQIIGQAFPELKPLGFTSSRLCWYTDTANGDDCVIDFVPGYSDSLFLCAGHGFKFLPNLGKYVVHRLEGVQDQFTEAWGWRGVKEGGDWEREFPGSTSVGLRGLEGYEMADEVDFRFDE